MMKKVSSVIALLFLVLFLLGGCVSSSSNLAISADDNDWVNFDDNDEGVYSYKKVNIEKDAVQVWRKKVFSDEGRKKQIQYLAESGYPTERFDKLSDARDLIEIDCKTLKKRTVSTTWYDQSKVIFFQYYDAEWSSITPNSHGETIFKGVCQ
jgi:hypothetical protein